MIASAAAGLLLKCVFARALIAATPARVAMKARAASKPARDFNGLAVAGSIEEPRRLRSRDLVFILWISLGYEIAV